MTSGSTDGWASAIVLVPLVASILMVVAFFYWEARMPVEKAAMYVIGNAHTNHWLNFFYQTTPDVVVQKFLRPLCRRTIANFFLDLVVPDFYHLVAKYISLVSYIVCYTYVRSSLSLDAVH